MRSLHEFDSAGTTSPLLSLANETLDEIVCYTDWRNALQFVRVCKRIQAVVSRKIYRDPVVDDSNAKALFCVIASPARRLMEYGSLVRSLTLKIANDDSIYVVYPVFCLAAGYMDQLHSLTLSIPPNHTPFLHQRMRNTSIIRNATPFFSDISARLLPPMKPVQNSVLPAMEKLVICGAIQLLDIAKYRNLSCLEVIFPLRFPGLVQVLEALTGNYAPNTLIRRLVIVLDLEEKQHVTTSLSAISDALPFLECLIIFSSKINGAVSIGYISGVLILTRFLQYIMEIFSENLTVFSRIRELGFNVNARRVIIGEISTQKYHDPQQNQLFRASSTRRCFTLGVFGDIMWTRTGETWTKTRRTPMRVSYLLSEDEESDTTETEDGEELDPTDNEDLDGEDGEYQFEPESDEDDFYIPNGTIASNHDYEASDTNPLPIPVTFLSDASVYPTFPALYFIYSQNDA